MTAVAIVIPTLNRAPLLVGAIESALECKPAPEEIIVVDCGSTDDTRAVVRSFGDRVALLERQLPNAASARNAGFMSSRSPYVGFLDSDDLALPGKTGGLAAVLDGMPEAGLVHGAMGLIHGVDETDVGGSVQDGDTGWEARDRRTRYSDLAVFCSMYTSATLMKRSAFEEIGGYDESLDAYEDWDLYLRLSLVGGLVYDKSPSCLYRVWEGNVPWERTARGVSEVARKHLSMLQIVPESMRTEAELGFRIRLAGSLYAQLRLEEARHEAIAAVRSNPLAAFHAPEVRRALTRSFVPVSVLRRLRTMRSVS